MIKERVREILIQNFRRKALFVQKLSDQEDFIKQGLFNSFELINIVLLIEHEFNIKIDVADFANERLSSLERIEKLVSFKKGLSSG